MGGAGVGGPVSFFRPVDIKTLRALYQDKLERLMPDREMDEAVSVVRQAYSGNIEERVCRDFSIMLVHVEKEAPPGRPFYCLPQRQREGLVKTAGKIKEDPFAFNDYVQLLESTAQSFDPLYMGKNASFTQANRKTYTKR